jgi:hypothetical protein
VNDPREPKSDVAAADVGAFCRRVEEHLTRMNAGHLVRIVGPAFDLVKQWALDGMPISVVVHGIDRKAERHRHGHARRPLRIEFCEADVREAFEDWRRAVGMMPSSESGDSGSSEDVPAPRKPSLTRHLDRVVERLVASGSRLDLPEPLRDRVNGVLADVVGLRDRARAARGPARDVVATALAPLDDALVAAARETTDAAAMRALADAAASELESYRARLSPDAWRRAVNATVDRLLRERLRLPTITQ